MFDEKKRADIITIRSQSSPDDVDRMINKAIEELKIKNDDKLQVKKAGAAIRVTGENAEKPGNCFAVEIVSRNYEDYTDIDVSALGGSSDIDYEESVQMRHLLLEDLTAEYRQNLNKRLKHLKNVRRREIARKLSELREKEGNNMAKEDIKNKDYEACLVEQRLLEKEIESLEKELKEYDTKLLPGKDRKESIFAYNIRYSEYSEEELSLKTGISAERIKCLLNGDEPLLSELISLSMAFDVPTEELIFNEWYKFIFGDYYDYSGKTLAECVKNKDLKQLSFLASNALMRYDDEIIYKSRYKIKPERKPDEELLDAARRLLIENDMPEIASRLSTKKSYITVKKLSELNVSDDTAFRYLFEKGTRVAFSYFIPFFNGLDNDDDKEHLLARLLENLTLYLDRDEYSGGESEAGKYIYYIEKTQGGMYLLSRPWLYTDFSLLETKSGLIKDIIKLQDKLFENLAQ